MAALEAAERDNELKQAAAKRLMELEARQRKQRREDERLRGHAWREVHRPRRVVSASVGDLAAVPSARTSKLLIKSEELTECAHDPTQSVLDLAKRRVEERQEKGPRGTRAQLLQDEMKAIASDGAE